MILSSDLSTFIGPLVPGVSSFLASVPQNSIVSGMVHHFVIHNLAGVCPLDSLHGNAIVQDIKTQVFPIFLQVVAGGSLSVKLDWYSARCCIPGSGTASLPRVVPAQNLAGEGTHWATPSACCIKPPCPQGCIANWPDFLWLHASLHGLEGVSQLQKCGLSVWFQQTK